MGNCEHPLKPITKKSWALIVYSSYNVTLITLQSDFALLWVLAYVSCYDREFYYIQMEKYARQALAEGVKNSSDLIVTTDSELYRVLVLHYNRNNQIEVCRLVYDILMNTSYISYILLAFLHILFKCRSLPLPLIILSSLFKVFIFFILTNRRFNTQRLSNILCTHYFLYTVRTTGT